MTKPISATSQDFQTTEDDQGNKQYFAVFNLQFEDESKSQQLHIQTTKHYREIIASSTDIQATEHTWQNALLQSWNAYDRRSFFSSFGKKEEVTFELKTNEDGFFYDLTNESKGLLEQKFTRGLNGLASSSSAFGLYPMQGHVNIAAHIMSPHNQIPLPTFQDEEAPPTTQASM